MCSDKKGKKGTSPFVSEVSDVFFVAQGTGKQTFYVLKNGIEKTVCVDFDHAPIQKVEL